jgi:hypothetical protein
MKEDTLMSEFGKKLMSFVRDEEGLTMMEKKVSLQHNSELGNSFYFDTLVKEYR